MSKKRTRRARKQRRATKAVLRFGKDARPKHVSKSGRTGKVAGVQRKSRKHGKSRIHAPSDGAP